MSEQRFEPPSGGMSERGSCRPDDRVPEDRAPRDRPLLHLVPTPVAPLVAIAAGARKAATLAYLDALRARIEGGEVVGLFAIEDRGRSWTNAFHVRSYMELVAMLEISKAEAVRYLTQLAEDQT